MDSLLDDFQRVVRAMLEQLPRDTGGPRLVDVLAAHLGLEPHTLAVVAAPVPPHRLVDADIALAEVAEDDPDRSLVGIAGDARHHMSLGDLVQGTAACTAWAFRSDRSTTTACRPVRARTTAGRS